MDVEEEGWNIPGQSEQLFSNQSHSQAVPLTETMQFVQETEPVLQMPTDIGSGHFEPSGATAAMTDTPQAPNTAPRQMPETSVTAQACGASTYTPILQEAQSSEEGIDTSAAECTCDKVKDMNASCFCLCSSCLDDCEDDDE